MKLKTWFFFRWKVRWWGRVEWLVEQLLRSREFQGHFHQRIIIIVAILIVAIVIIISVPTVIVSLVRGSFKACPSSQSIVCVCTRLLCHPDHCHHDNHDNHHDNHQNHHNDHQNHHDNHDNQHDNQHNQHDNHHYHYQAGTWWPQGQENIGKFLHPADTGRDITKYIGRYRSGYFKIYRQIQVGILQNILADTGRDITKYIVDRIYCRYKVRYYRYQYYK